MPTATRVTLPDFDGLPVRRAAMRIMNAALKLEPVALDHNDEVFVVLRGYVVDVQHPPDGKSEPGEIEALVRTHKVKAAEIAIVDKADVDELLAANRERLAEKRQVRERFEKEERAREADAMRLPGTEDTEVVLQTAHADGEHAEGLVDGCPLCDEERDAEATEATAAKKPARSRRKAAVR